MNKERSKWPENGFYAHQERKSRRPPRSHSMALRWSRSSLREGRATERKPPPLVGASMAVDGGSWPSRSLLSSVREGSGPGFRSTAFEIVSREPTAVDRAFSLSGAQRDAGAVNEVVQSLKRTVGRRGSRFGGESPRDGRPRDSRRSKPTLDDARDVDASPGGRGRERSLQRRVGWVERVKVLFERRGSRRRCH